MSSTPASRSVIPSASTLTSSGSVKVRPRSSCWPTWSGKARAGDGGDRPDGVDMTVRRQHRHRLEPVLCEDLLDPVFRVLARVDDEALLAGPGRHDVAIRGERAGRESGDQHG